MKIIWFTIWLLFVPLLFVAIIITYISYVMFKDKRIYNVLAFYLEFFHIPYDIIFEIKDSEPLN
jgi:hypothetical protein